jgi:outer membrane receptor protein involved in Fe transport
VLSGRFTGSIIANNTQRLRLFAFQDRPDEQNIEEGEIGDPEWSFITNALYERGPFKLLWRSRYEGEVSLFALGVDTPEDISPAFIDAQWYHDFVLRVALPAGESEAYIGVNNAFDEPIPFGLDGSGTGAGYELLGRYVFGGFRARF